MPYVTTRNAPPRAQNPAKEPRTGAPRHPHPHNPEQARRGPYSERDRPGVPAAPDWVNDAACARTDPESFFPTKGANAERARSVCQDCPVQAMCLAYAIADPSLDGVWGGTTRRERIALRNHPTAA